MKKLSAIFLSAILVFAQDIIQPETDSILQELSDSVQMQTADSANLTDSAQISEVLDTADTAAAADTADTLKKHTIFFAGVQTGDIPEIRETLERMIRMRFGTESNIKFVDKTSCDRILRKLFINGEITADSVFFNELAKQGFQNTIVLLINTDEYSVKPVRRFLFGAGVKGILNADFLFYDASAQTELFAVKLSGESLVKKPPVFWKSLNERVTVSADDLKKINSDLLNAIVEQGFEAMNIAVSAKK